MAKPDKKKAKLAAPPPKPEPRKRAGKAAKPDKPATSKEVVKKLRAMGVTLPPPVPLHVTSGVLEQLWAVILARRDADPRVSHSARLLSRGVAKCAQKFGEEAVECLIEAVAGNRQALVAESADVLYHMLVMWVAAGVTPAQVWAELKRREGVSGIAEKAGRAAPRLLGVETRKIP